MSAAQGLGGNLIEISAVATIIGAPTAEALIHGLKGACGMAWAPDEFLRHRSYYEGLSVRVGPGLAARCNGPE